MLSNTYINKIFKLDMITTRIIYLKIWKIHSSKHEVNIILKGIKPLSYLKTLPFVPTYMHPHPTHKTHMHRIFKQSHSVLIHSTFTPRLLWLLTTIIDKRLYIYHLNKFNWLFVLDFHLDYENIYDFFGWK
jgi:hypothetical protein